MNTSFNRLVAAICIAMIFVLNSTSSFAGNYTWTGNSSKNWDNASNWSPSGVPSTNDTVNISDGSGNQTVQLNSNVSINRLVISGRAIDLNTRQLTISSRASLNGGSINNGTLIIRGTYAYFQGTNSDCNIDCITGQIKFSGGTFNGTCSFEHNGTSNGWGEGGCTFNAPVTIKKSGSSTLRLGQTNADAFNSTVEFICTSSGPIEVSQGSHAIFNNTVYLNCTHSTGSITFCAQTTTADLVEEGHLETGSTGITAGRITIKGLVQDNANANQLTGTGSALISIDSCAFPGAMSVTSPCILFKNNTFNGECTFIKTTASTNSYNYGNNVFNAAVTIENQDASRAFRFANDAGDHFNGEVIFTTGSNNIQVAYKGNSYFAGDITINNNKVVFNASSGKVILTGTQAQTIGGGAAYAISKLEINKDGGNVQLDRAMTIDSSITFVNGIISTDSVITLKAATTCNGASNQSFVDGPVKKIGNTAFVFPVGDEGQWNPIEISAPANATDAFTAQNFLNPQTYGNNKDTSIYRLNTCSYWNLFRNTGNSKVYVKLYWDSLRCTLYDTAGLGVASWTGSKWEDLRSGGTTGNVLAGSVVSDTTSGNYTAFTWAYRNNTTSLITITTSPTLNSLNHPVSEDYFGYNGANILDDGQYYSDLAANPLNSNQPVLIHNGISTIRLNGGTFGNYWDWRTGWFIPEDQLPNNWFYTRRSFKQSLPAQVNFNFVNDMSFFKVSNDIVGSRPIFQLNSLTSSFNYEVASLYRAGQLNLPVRYIELGNEFYLNDEQYKERFPSSLDYINFATDFTNQLKSIAPFQNVQVAVVGSSTPNGIPGRRSLWLEVILDNINKFPTHRPDAITIHEYYASGLKEQISTGQPTNSNIGKMLKKPFTRRDDLFADELTDIAQANSSLNLNPQLEVWLTEYNLDESQGNNIGTWAHGLFNAIQTLTYLESPLITHVNSHAMTSNAVFGNIFENSEGFTAMTPGQLPTNIPFPATSFKTDKFGFTASGAALNEIALALKGNSIIAHQIDFTNPLVQKIRYFDSEKNPPQWVTSSYPELYGWSFEKENGSEAIVLNLGPNVYRFEQFDAVGLYNSATIDFTSIVQLTSNDQTAGNGGVNCPVGDCDDPLISTNEVEINTISSTDPLVLPPYSLTRLIFRDPTVISIRLTDDEICEGSETSVLVSGAQPGAQIALFYGTTQIGSSQTDSVFIFGSNLPTGTHQITAHVGSLVSPPAILHVNTALNVTASVTSGAVAPCSIQTITLSANATPTPPNTNYTYLWVPDKHIIGSNTSPFQQSIDLDNTTLTSESYQVFVFNGECWASSNLINFDRGPISVDLGNDFTVCTGNAVSISLHAETVLPPLASIGTLYYSLSDNGTPVGQVQTSNIFTIAGPISAGTHTYRVSAWSVNGSTSTANCPVIDEVVVNVVNCCNCTSSVELSPHEYQYETVINGTPYNSYYNVSTMEDLYQELTAPTDLNFVVNTNVIGQEITIQKGSISNPVPVICINGDFWVNPAKLGGSTKEFTTIIFEQCTLRLGPNAAIKTRGRAKLILKSCMVESCNGTELWDGIYADISDQGLTEPELQITKLGTGARSKIKQAKNGVVIRRDSPYAIEYCDFEDNYIDIKFEKCGSITKQGTTATGSSAMFASNFLRSNTFTSSGGYLLAPYNNIHKFAAIVLDDVERVVIGDSSLSTSVTANVFENSNFGIRAHKSSIELYNNSFTEIDELDGEVLEVDGKGSCVYHRSVSDYNDRNLIVGNLNPALTPPLVSRRNIFTKSRTAIFSFGESNITIFNNEFGSPSSNQDFIEQNCISVFSNPDKSIYIGRENDFYDYRRGILINGITDQTQIDVSENNFHNGRLRSPAGNFDGTAIQIAARIPISRMEDARIHNNQIGIWDGSNYYQPRIGIHIANTGGVKIEDNEIRFNLTAVPGELYRGIRLEGSPECLVRGNIIDNHLTGGLPGFNGMLTGVRVDVSAFTEIKCNTISNVGYCMDFQGENAYVPMADNSMNSYNLGINLGFLNGTTTVPTNIGWQQGNPYTGFGNTWNDITSGRDRAEGFIIQPIRIPWYHHNAVNFANEECPIPSSGFPNAIIEPIGNMNGYLEFPCNIDDPILSQARALAFCDIIADTVRYDNPNAADIHYAREHALYRFLKTDTSRIYAGEEDDDAYDAYFHELGVMNVGKYYSVLEYINNGQLDLAMELIQTIEDTCTQEEYLKSVLIIELNSLMSNEVYSAEDSSVLRETAYLQSLQGGLATKIARAMLGLEVEDIGEGGSRLMKKPTIENFNYSVQPIPAKDHLELVTNNTAELTYHIFDMVGNNVTIGTRNTEPIDIRELAPGVYTIVVYPENDKQQCLKFIKLK